MSCALFASARSMSRIGFRRTSTYSPRRSSPGLCSHRECPRRKSITIALTIGRRKVFSAAMPCDRQGSANSFARQFESRHSRASGNPFLVLGAQMENDEQAVRQLVTTWLDASKAGDTEKVLSLMTDDVVFLVAGQPPMRGKAAFAASQSALKAAKIDATSEIQEIKVVGDWAYMWTKLSVVITPPNGAAPIKRAGNTLSILRRQADNWLIARDANMLAVVSK